MRIGISESRIDSPQRLMYVITGLGWGGAESQVISLAREFKTRGWDVSVVSLLAPTPRWKELEAYGIPVTSLGMRRGVPDLRALWRFVRCVRSFKPDVVHAHMIHPNLLTRLARIIAPVPVVISTGHSTDEKSRLRELAYRWTDRLSDLTTNVSEASVRRYVEVRIAPAERIRFVPNGIDLSRFSRDRDVRSKKRKELSLGDSDFVWVAVGRFDEQKDYPNLLRAVAELDDVPFKLLVAGDGSLLPDMRQMAKDLMVQDKVHFLGVRSDINELMNAADAFVMSSAWEALPMALLEAAATALPIVATDVGGCAQIVLDGQTGRCIRSQDSVALADAMRQIMGMEENERHQLGFNGAEHAREMFGLDNVVDQWSEIYQELCP